MSYILVLFFGLAAVVSADNREDHCKSLGDGWSLNRWTPQCNAICEKRWLVIFKRYNYKIMENDSPCSLPLSGQAGVCKMAMCIEKGIAESLDKMIEKTKEQASKISKDLIEAAKNIQEGNEELAGKAMEAAKKYIESLVDQIRAKTNDLKQ